MSIDSLILIEHVHTWMKWRKEKQDFCSNSVRMGRKVRHALTRLTLGILGCPCSGPAKGQRERERRETAHNEYFVLAWFLRIFKHNVVLFNCFR